MGCATALKTAGPAHNPLAPQPAPNVAAPITNLQSTPCIVFVESENLSANFGAFESPVQCILAMFGRIPSSIISDRLGSHFVRSSGKKEKAKKAETLAGKAMPETIRPRPNV